MNPNYLSWNLNSLTTFLVMLTAITKEVEFSFLCLNKGIISERIVDRKILNRTKYTQ